jgi:hypothetical protein
MALAAPPMTSRNSGQEHRPADRADTQISIDVQRTEGDGRAPVVLRNKAIKPLLAAAQDLRASRGAQNPRALDRHYDPIRTAMQGVFQELGLAA